MGQTNSAHEIAEHDNIEDAAVAGLKLNLRDYRRGYGDWDHTLIWCGPLADMPESMRRGWEPDDEWEPDRHVDLTQLPEYKAAQAEAKRQIAEEQEREQRRRQREAERQEQREQAAKCVFRGMSASCSSRSRPPIPGISANHSDEAGHRFRAPRPSVPTGRPTIPTKSATPMTS